MPRKPLGIRADEPQRIGFNEAAARCRGNLPVSSEEWARERRASMRPRPDAAETGEEDPRKEKD